MITHGYKPAYRLGGPIQSVSNLAEYLVKRGHKVRVFATNSNLDKTLDVETEKAIHINGVEVWYFQEKFIFSKKKSKINFGFFYAPSMLKYIDWATDQADIIHIQIPFIYPGIIASKSALKLGKPYVYSQRGVLDSERLSYKSLKKKLYLYFVERKILKKAKILIALTRYESNSYRKLGLTNLCNIIPNGISIPKNPKKNIKDKKTFTILYLGRIHPLKGVHILLESFLNVASQLPNVKIVIAGPDECGLKEKYKSTVESLNLNSRVLFKGMLQGKMKEKAFLEADLFCLPSSGEGFSMAILEALSYSLPVLISPQCHFSSVVNANCGFVVKSDIKKISGLLIKIFSNSEQLFEMGCNGKNFVENNYSWDIVTNKMLKTYQQAINY